MTKNLYLILLLTNKLKNKGYEVITAADGAEGLEKLNLYDPDVVITDIKMPGTDGRVLCEKINNSNNDKPYLIIVVTCSVSDSNMRWISNMRDTLLLEKHFSPTRVLETIEDHVEN